MKNRDIVTQIVDSYIEMQDANMLPEMRLWCLKCAEAGIKVIERSWRVMAEAAGIPPLDPKLIAPFIVRVGFLMVREGMKRGLFNDASPHN